MVGLVALPGAHVGVFSHGDGWVGWLEVGGYVGVYVCWVEWLDGWADIVGSCLGLPFLLVVGVVYEWAWVDRGLRRVWSNMGMSVPGAHSDSHVIGPFGV